LLQKVGLLETEVVKCVLVVEHEGSRSQKAIAIISDRQQTVANDNPQPPNLPPYSNHVSFEQFKPEIGHLMISPIRQIGVTKWKK